MKNIKKISRSFKESCVLVVLLVTVGLGCSYRAPKNKDQKSGSSPSGEGGGVAPLPAGTKVSYRMVQDGVFEKKCSGCHKGASPDGDLDLFSYAAVSARLKEIKTRVFESPDDPMPPSDETALTEEERSTLKTWLDQGAPENNE